MLLLTTFALGACVVEPVPEGDAGDEAAEAELDQPVSCMLHTDCAGDQRCRFAPGSCGDALGTCEPIGLESADSLMVCGSGPVCGCDGRDYGDACGAWNDSVSVWFEGSCANGPPAQEPPPAVDDPVDPGCPGGCAPGSFCFSDNGTCGGGSCRPASGACTGSASAVCGCDGVTYDSVCDAVQNEMSVAYPGGC
jgi:hypothetical protein